MKNIILFLLLAATFNAQAIVKTWTMMYGSKFGSSGFAVASDSQNNIYAAGRTMGGFDKQKHAGYTDDACLSKITPDGKRVWTRIWGTEDQDGCYGITVDKNDDIIVVGYLSGTIDGQPFLGEKDFFAAKYNSKGEKIWLKTWGTVSYDYAKDVASDDDGNIYVVGTTMGAFDGYENNSWNDICVSKLNSSGELLWVRQFGSSSGDFAEGIAVNGKNEILVCGGIKGPLDGENGVGNMDMFLKCYDTNGATNWTKLWGSTDFDIAYGLFPDTNDNVFVAGWVNGQVDGQPYAGNGDFCVTKFNGNGSNEWTKMWGTDKADWLRAVQYADDKLFVAGVTSGGISNKNNIGEYDLYLAELTFDGEIIGERLWGSNKKDYAVGMCRNNLNDLFVIGESFGSVDGQKNKAIKDALNIFVSAFSSVTNLDITSLKGKTKPGKINLKIYHQNPVEYYFDAEVYVAINNVTNIFSSVNGEWKWNKKGTVGKLKRADKSIIKIKGANSKKRKMIIKIMDTNFQNNASNFWIGFSNGQSDSTEINFDSKGIIK